MKYYVKSNNFEVVVGGEHIESAEDAACEAFLHYYKDNTVISPLIIVSERGFEYCNHEHIEDKVFDTCKILEKAGFEFEE